MYVNACACAYACVYAHTLYISSMCVTYVCHMLGMHIIEVHDTHTHTHTHTHSACVFCTCVKACYAYIEVCVRHTRTHTHIQRACYVRYAHMEVRETRARAHTHSACVLCTHVDEKITYMHTHECICTWKEHTYIHTHEST
jgi:hypothetical protein